MHTVSKDTLVWNNISCSYAYSQILKKLRLRLLFYIVCVNWYCEGDINMH